jgi:glycosyltransferase involved in cell wall biosynthesis
MVTKPPPTLSLCIPTWNRAHILPPLLESIAAQWREEVELVVADNASSDDTAAIVKALRKRIPQLTYTRPPANRGFDANLERLVHTARGDYCWFLGSDDRVYPGAIARVLDTIQNAPGALIVGDVHTLSLDGTPVKEEPSTAWPDYSVFHFDEPGTIARYLARATSVRAVFPFIANIVFPRAAWPRGPMPREWADKAYRHLYACWRMVLDGTPVVTRRKLLVWATVGFPNRRDAETAAGVKQAVDAVACLARMVPPGEDRAALRRVWRFEYPPARRRSLEERCRREPAWRFIRHQLERMLRGGIDR